MKANVLMAACFITLPRIIVAQNANGTGKISMLVSQDHGFSYKVHLLFTNETFQKFYSCLRYSSWKTCTGYVSNDPPPPFPILQDDRYIGSVGSDFQPVTFSDPDYFDCNYASSATQLQCQRFVSPCNTTGYFSFHLCNSTYCDPGCVRILSNQGEEIRQENTDIVKPCNVSCKDSTTSVTELVTPVPSTQVTRTFSKSVTTLPSQSSVPSSHTTLTTAESSTLEYSTAESSTHGSGKQTKEEASDSNIPVIAGVVSGCAAIILIGIIIWIVLWRRKHRSRSKAQHPQNVPFSDASVASSGNLQQNVHNSDFQANSLHLPAKPSLKVTSYENQITPSNNNDIDYGYIDIHPPYTGNGYTNVLHHTEQGDIISKHNQDPDYEMAANIDPYNEATTSPEAEDDYSEKPEIEHPYNEGSTPEVYDDYSENAVLPSTHDDYSTARNDNNLQIIDMAPHPKNVYARLGEDFRDIKNPYNVVPQKKHNQKSKNPIPESPKQDRTSYETVQDSGKIVNISTPAPQTESSINSHNGSNQPDKINKNNVTTDIPEYAVVMKHKENISKPIVTIDIPEYAAVRKQKK